MDHTGRRRGGWSLGPLGLRGRPKRITMKHAIANITEFADAKAWAKSLQRSCRCTMTKQVPKAVRQYGMQIRSCEPRHLGLQHALVLIDHQLKSFGWCKLPLVFLVVFIRCLAAKCMHGVVDEIWIGDKMVAWSQVIVKGDTMRAMWFYQRDEASRQKMCLWHATLLLAVHRAISMPEVKWVDLGPSKTDELAAAKVKFGFENTREWPDMCGYNGEFVLPSTEAAYGMLFEEEVEDDATAQLARWREKQAQPKQGPAVSKKERRAAKKTERSPSGPVENGVAQGASEGIEPDCVAGAQ
mmetsp:Transcript_43622/g.92690  ORF Transcript_43622/g.92690 Transcript_43622/m.92690 type:complete len:298 (-) Transcript_43622:82-975(-)